MNSHQHELERLRSVLKMLRTAARDKTLSDRYLRNILIYVNFEELPTAEDVQRTHELAAQLGWERSLENATWVAGITEL